MRTETVVSGDVKATVRSANRRTPINSAIYLKALMNRYPDVEKLEFTSEEKAIDMAIHNPVPLALYDSITKFVQLATRLTAIEGIDFTLDNNHRFTTEELYKAYDHYVDDDSDFWDKVKSAIEEMDKPLSPPEQWGVAAMSDEQKKIEN